MQYENGVHAIQTFRPFLLKWGCLPDDFDAMAQRILAGARKDTCRAPWNVLVVWGIKDSD